MKLEAKMFNMQPSPVDKRDFTFPLAGSDVVVDDFIVGDVEHPVYNQFSTSMCSSFAAACIQEYYDDERFSPAFLYGNREADEYIGEGEYSRNVMKDWLRDGICLYEDFPLVGDVEECIAEFDKLPEDVIESGKKHRIEAFYKLNRKDPQGVFELMEMFDLPVYVSIPLYSSFAEAWEDDGIVPVPKEGDEYIGGHAVRFVGKKTIDGMEHYVMPNSWGKDVPDNGVQYIPIDYPVWEIWMPMPYVEKTITLTAGESNYFVNEELRTMDTEPVNIDGRVYVPLRFVVEAIGNVYVEWDDEERTARIYRGGNVYHFAEGGEGFFSEYSLTFHEYEDDESRKGLTTNIINDDNRMLVPVRKLCEVFGFDVEYDNDTQIITISNY